MARFLVRADAVEGDRVRFDAAEARHLGRVLRLGPGDVVHAVDGHGHEWTIRLTEVGPRSAIGDVLDRRSRPRESPLALTLVQGLGKADKMDVIVRMATELGVARVAPVITERTVAGAEPARWPARHGRWQRVAREAAKQCGRAVAPTVDAPRSLDTWLDEPGDRGLLVCLWEGATAPVGRALPAPPITHATLVIGPEGGLAAREVERLERAGAIVAGLGPRILRTETAGPVAIALLQHRYGDLG